MKYIPRNNKGEVISGIRKLAKDEYGLGYADNGERMVNWNLLSKYADDNGFDIRNMESNSTYIIDIQLPKETLLIRYGNEMGRFTAPKGTKYANLALPYICDTVEYNEYRVIADGLHVTCIVKKGKVAPGFGSLGGAIQYLHPYTIKKKKKMHILERVNLW